MEYTHRSFGNVAGAALLSSLLASPLAIAVLLIGLLVALAVGYVILWAFGLVMAVILGAVGVVFLGLIHKIDKTLIGKHWWLLLLPLGMFVVGYALDHLPRMALVNQITVVSAAGVAVASWVLALIIVVVGVCLLAALYGKKKRRKRR